jgi:hypothetical protein
MDFSNFKLLALLEEKFEIILSIRIKINKIDFIFILIFENIMSNDRFL